MDTPRFGNRDRREIIMSIFPPDLNNENQNHLRLDAETRLREGSTPPTKSWAVSADSLALLYRLASVSDTAGDALKLLHELQVHQVELDLQHEQIEANERDLVHALDRYKAFYDYAPVGYFIVGLDGRIIEVNAAGAELLGVEQNQFYGCRIDRFLAPESQLTMAGLMKKLRDKGSRASCEVRSLDDGNGSRQLRITANVAPDGDIVLMTFCESD